MKEDYRKHQKSPFKEKPPSKSEIIGNKFSYSFNPTMNPAFHGNLKSGGSLKAMSYNNLAHPLKIGLSSVKSELKPLNMKQY